jgi:ABC-type cobalamin transport system permease subunit
VTGLTIEEDMDGVTFRAYLQLVKAKEPIGPRDLMRRAELSSPAVSHRVLQKLLELGLAEKDAYGRYSVKEKMGLKGYFWLGNNLVPRFILYGFFLAGLLLIEVLALGVRLLNNESIESSYFLLVGVTTFSAVTFLTEGLRVKNKIKQ